MDEQSKDIYNLLLGAEKRKQKRVREELLHTVGVDEEYFEGSIKIDKFTCRGVECKLCIEACPTCALYWGGGEVKIQEDLCIYCTACVLSCIVDDCIVITRKRKSGEVEKFSNPREVKLLMDRKGVRQRGVAVKSIMEELSKKHDEAPAN